MRQPPLSQRLLAGLGTVLLFAGLSLSKAAAPKHPEWRSWSQAGYGISPEQVIGSSQAVRRTMQDGKPVLLLEPQLDFIDDGPGKPVGIYRHIGRRPILAVGNSDGDLQMLEYTTGGDGPRLGALIHHHDAEREFAYDRASHFGKLDKALDAGT